LLFLQSIYACTKAKIQDNCENNTIEISPKDFNTDSASFFIPTAFTPNGDELNEMFKPFLGGVSLKEFEVCKRNNVLFSTTDINQYWDGTDTNGDLCKYGVYTYNLTVNNGTDGDIEICGEVSLITEEKNQICDRLYGDQVDPSSGFIYPTAETCNPDQILTISMHISG
jgi:hypothetical protein